MKIASRFLIAIAGLGLTVGAAEAQTVDQRHAYQQHRIIQGERSGRLTPWEARRAERQQMALRRQEARMRYAHGGRLTGRDRAVLQHRENRVSRHIYHAKHNGRGW